MPGFVRYGHIENYQCNRKIFYVINAPSRKSVWGVLVHSPFSCLASDPIGEVHPVAHSSACMQFFLSFYLGHLHFQDSKDQKTEKLLLSARSSPDIHELRGNRFCVCYSQALALTKSASLVPLSSTTGTKFFHRAVLVTQHQFLVQPRGISSVSSRESFKFKGSSRLVRRRHHPD